MEAVKLEHLCKISKVVTYVDDWHEALDKIFKNVRPIFIFDNMVIYTTFADEDNAEVAYARAIGRGRSAEADIAWGEELANRVITTQKRLMEEPASSNGDNRLKRPYLLGIPLMARKRRLGAIVFIRFGGPAFSEEDIQIAELLCDQVALLMEHKTLEQEYQELEKKHRRSLFQEDFLSNIAHELRNPLGFIKGYTTTLLRDDTIWDIRTQQEFLQIIDRETDHLGELIENLTDSLRLQQGQLNMTFQPTRLESVLSDVITRASLHYPSLVIHFENDGDLAPIQADSRRLAQVFENLISNAYKYAPGSEVWIRVRQGAGDCQLEFQDRGPGIAPQYLPHIFDRFFRSPDCPPNVHGSGLGLYICKQIIQAHHGSISITSTLGEGTTFHILLPRNPETIHESSTRNR